MNFHLKPLTQTSSKSYLHTHSSNQFSFAFPTSFTNGSRSRTLTKAGTHSTFPGKSHTGAYTPKRGASLLCSRAAHLTVPHQTKEQPEGADARLWRVSASSGAAAPQAACPYHCHWFAIAIFSTATITMPIHRYFCHQIQLPTLLWYGTMS